MNQEKSIVLSLIRPKTVIHSIFQIKQPCFITMKLLVNIFSMREQLKKENTIQLTGQTFMVLLQFLLQRLKGHCLLETIQFLQFTGKVLIILKFSISLVSKW